MGKADWCWVKDHPEGRTAMLIVSTGVDGQWACSQECFSAGRHVPPRDMQRAYPAPEDPAPAWEVAAMAQHSAGFAEDAKRLAELRADRDEAKAAGRFLPTGVETLIAVYEECQARGRLFGGLR